MSLGALHVARTGLDAQSFRMQVIANNLANVNTTGFKRDRASFETLSYQLMTQAGAPSTAENRYATGLNLGTGVALNGTARIDTQGTFQTTGNGLDVAIDGAGYFQVELPDGRIGYTRAGNFGRAPDGTIVTPDGKPLTPAIQIPEDAGNVSIGLDGTVSATAADGTALEPRRAPGDRRQHARRDAGLGRPAGRRRGRGRARHAARRDARGIERQCRRRACRHDRNAARL
jgi:flagellar basal-body rod protein FlgG